MCSAKPASRAPGRRSSIRSSRDGRASTARGSRAAEISGRQRRPGRSAGELGTRVRAGRLSRRHAARQGPRGRLRRVGHAAEVGRAGHAGPRSSFRSSIGGVVVAVNIDGVPRGRDQAHRAGARRHLPRKDHPLVGSRDQGAQPGADAARRADRRRSTARTAPARRSTSPTTCPKVSPEWKLKVGAAPAGAWPTGTAARATRASRRAVQASQELDRLRRVRAGDAAEAQRTPSLQNRAGRFVRPDTASFQAAAASADWARPSDFYVLLTESRRRAGLPHHRDRLRAHAQDRVSARRTRAALDFFRWSLEKGCGIAAAARLRAAARPAGSAGQSLLGTDLPGRELMPERALPAGAEPPARWQWDPGNCWVSISVDWRDVTAFEPGRFGNQTTDSADTQEEGPSMAETRSGKLNTSLERLRRRPGRTQPAPTPSRS